MNAQRCNRRVQLDHGRREWSNTLCRKAVRENADDDILTNSIVSPLFALCLGEYWFQISLYVYDRNRPLAPILRQRWCSLMYDVYLTCIDGDV